MLVVEPVEGCPAHPLWLPGWSIEDSTTPPEAPSDALGASERAKSSALSRARICQSVTLAAGKGAAVVVKDCHATRASPSWTDEPGTRSAKMAVRSLDLHRVLPMPPRLTVAAKSAHEHDVTCRGSNP